MHWAAIKGNIKTIKELIKRGADCTIADNNGNLVDMAAAKKGYFSTQSLLRYEIDRVLHPSPLLFFFNSSLWPVYFYFNFFYFNYLFLFYFICFSLNYFIYFLYFYFIFYIFYYFFLFLLFVILLTIFLIFHLIIIFCCN